MVGRNLLAGLAVAAVFAGCAQTRNVSVKLTYLVPYCGGARPTQEIMQEAEKPKPYAGRTVVLVSEGRTDSAKTDKSGLLKKKLKAGKYRMVESWRYYRRTPDGAPLTNYDAECLKAEWEREFAVLTVTSRKQVFERRFQIIDHCERKRPCILESALGPEPQ